MAAMRTANLGMDEHLLGELEKTVIRIVLKFKAE